MKRSSKIATAVALSLGLGLAAGVYAQPGQMGGGMQHGMKGGHEGRGAGNQLMTPEERTAFQEKMRNAKTPEERQQIAQATRTEMQKRAQAKGITLPEGRGPGTGTTTQAPATTEHAH